MAGRKKIGAGGKLARSEVVTVRLDPRLRYGVELAGRKHRRTASSFIEWAIENALKQVIIREGKTEYEHEQWSITAADVLSQVWDVDEPDRFAKLAINFPELLNHDEQVLWKLVRECGYLWRGKFVKRGDIEEYSWDVSEQKLIKDRLRDNWGKFLKVADGELPFEKLPKWEKERMLEKDDFDDDIPF